MRPERLIIAFVLGCALPLPPVAAETPLVTLSTNPFTRPKMLEVKPQVVQAKAVLKAEPVEIRLSATMLSAISPMVIADGELLRLGDSIKGLQLVEVMEGRAVFRGANGRVTYSIDEIFNERQ